MGSDIKDDVLQLIEAVFQNVRVEAEMPRPITKAELANFTAPALVIAAEKVVPARAVRKGVRHSADLRAEPSGLRLRPEAKRCMMQGNMFWFRSL